MPPNFAGGKFAKLLCPRLTRTMHYLDQTGQCVAVHMSLNDLYVQYAFTHTLLGRCSSSTVLGVKRQLVSFTYLHLSSNFATTFHEF